MKKSDHSTHDFLKKEELHSYQIIGTEPEPEYTEIVTLAAKLCEVQIALISFNDGNQHWFKATYGFDDKEIYLENSISSKSQQTPEAIFEIYDIQADERFKNHPMLKFEDGARFCASVPLISHNGFAIGNLILIDRIPKKLNENQKDILKILSRQIIYLLNLRRKRLLIESAQKELEFRNKSLHDAVRQINDYKTALDETSIVSLTDTNGFFTYVNELFCSISGYSSEEILGQNISILNSGYHSKEFWSKLWETINKGKIWKGEIRNKRKDGIYFWVESTIVPLLDETTKKPYKFLTIRKDITEQKNIQQAELQSLLFAQEMDRDNFAQDLHEGLAQQIVAIRLQLQMLQENLKDSLSDHAKKVFEEISAQLQNATNQTKSMAIDLMPRTMMDDGIEASLNNYLNRFKTKYNVECSFDSHFFNKNLHSKSIEITLYRFIVNIIEKAVQSKVIERIKINLTDQPNLQLVIVINSTPLLENNYTQPLSKSLGFIGQLIKRVELNGGQVIISDSADNQSTEIKVVFE